MKNILLLVHGDAGQEARLQAALDIVRAVEGHLTCLDVAVTPVMADDGYGAFEMLMLEERQREAANRATLEPRLAAEGLPWSWIDAAGDLSVCLAAAAGLADLIVVNRALDISPLPGMQGVVGEVLKSAGKPILAVPESSRGIRLAGHAMIAWDGSDQASAALRAAVPLLRFAQRVTIVEVDDGSLAIPAVDAAAYLSRHDIGATVHPISRVAKGTAGEILTLVELMRPDYLVMGGFGHGRLREALFGGVTWRMLSDSPVALLLAH